VTSVTAVGVSAKRILKILLISEHRGVGIQDSSDNRRRPDQAGAGILVLVCLTLLGQNLAIAGQQESHHGSDHCCLLCHAGPLPFLQTVIAGRQAPVFAVAWLAPLPDFSPAVQPLLLTISSRGPPVL